MLFNSVWVCLRTWIYESIHCFVMDRIFRRFWTLEKSLLSYVSEQAVGGAGSCLVEPLVGPSLYHYDSSSFAPCSVNLKYYSTGLFLPYSLVAPFSLLGWLPIIYQVLPSKRRVLIAQQSVYYGIFCYHGCSCRSCVMPLAQAMSFVRPEAKLIFSLAFATVVA